MNSRGLSTKILLAFIAAAALLGIAAVISVISAGRSWDKFILEAQGRSAEYSAAADISEKLCSADTAILAAAVCGDISDAEEYLSSARSLLEEAEAAAADNGYFTESASVKELIAASEIRDSVFESISRGELSRASEIYFAEYQPKLRAAAEYADKVCQKISSESNNTRRLALIRSKTSRLCIGTALLGISVILFFALYIDNILRKNIAPVPDEPEPAAKDKYDTDTDDGGNDDCAERLEEAEKVIRTVAESINILADGDPDAAPEGEYPMEYGNVLSAVRKMKARLRFIGAQIKRASEFVSAESVRVSDNAEELSAAAEDQESAARALSECAEKMSALISESSDMIQSIEKDSENCRLSAEECASRIGAVNSAIDALRECMEEMNGLVHSVSDIASRSNLLAVNTAMSVSKGDCSEKNLASAADEARSLAIISAETSSEAEKIRERCEEAVKNTARVMENVSSAADELNKSCSGICEKAAAISSLSGRQTEAVRAVEGDIAKISGFVHLSKNAYEEYAASGRMLSEQTAALRKIIPASAENAEK